MGYKSDAQRKAVHASKADGGKGAPSKMYKKKSPAKKPLVGKQKNLPDHLKKKILASPAKMNRYDKDMMHERELIYDAKGQLHKADKAYKKGNKGKKQEMIHDRELIYDAKTDIHKEDKAKKRRAKGMKLGSPSDREKSRMEKKMKRASKKSPAEMSAELKYMPIVDREKSTMSVMGSHKILKHMKGRM